MAGCQRSFDSIDTIVEHKKPPDSGISPDDRHEGRGLSDFDAA
jgi:hypothetical protein